MVGRDPKGKKVAWHGPMLFAEFHAACLPSAWQQYVYRLALTLLEGRNTRRSPPARRTLTMRSRMRRPCSGRQRRGAPRGICWLFRTSSRTRPDPVEVILLRAPSLEDRRKALRLACVRGGDPTQSIYRFRRADIDTYLRVRQRIEESGGQVATLTTCFRSVPALCAWANVAFGALFPAEATPHQPGFIGLAPARDDKDAGFGVRTLTIPETVSKADAVAAYDASAIACFIRAEIDAGRRTPGDFLILTKARKALPIYTRALEAQRLPVEVSGGAAFAQSSAVTDWRICSAPSPTPTTGRWWSACSVARSSA
jgi:hypothetical protein